MAYSLYQASYGLSSANFRVKILEVADGTPAVIALQDGTVVNTTGDAIIDSYGNLTVYLDDTKTFGVHINQYLLDEADSHVATMVKRTALQLSSPPTIADQELGPGALFYDPNFPSTYYRISADNTSFISIIGTSSPPGSSGFNTAVILLYQRNATAAPSVPALPVTYTFATASATGLTNGWTTSVPAGTDPIYVTSAVARSQTPTDTIGSNEWATPVIFSQNGINSASVSIYQRTNTSTPPVTPDLPVTYTFSSGTVTGLDQGWSTSLPSTGGSYRWVSGASALATGGVNTDVINPAEWSAAALISQDGVQGASGFNNAIVYAYQRATSVPALPSATVTYTFATAASSGLNNGWSSTIPTGTNTIYVTIASATSTGATDTILPAEWATPVILTANGVDGTNGLNTATVFLYKVTNTSATPALPTSTVSYTFSLGIATGLTNGWTQSLPTTGGSYRWMTTASALSNTDTDTIAASEWAPASLLAQDGAQGAPGTPGSNGTNGTNGTNGINNAVVTLYQRSSSAPPLPNATITYTFATLIATGITNGWTQNIPSGTLPIWVTAASASATGSFDTINASEWATPVVQTQNGIDGTNTATVYLFQRTSTSVAPSLPSANITYDFTTGIATGITNSWTQTLPPIGGPYRWVTTATALSNTSTDVITGAEWAAASILAQDGVTGATGTAGTNGLNNAVVIVYQRSAVGVPAVPSAVVTYTFATAVISGLTNGWTSVIPAGTDPIYATSATASGSGASDTITSAEWATPVILAQNGTPGANGTNGVNGINGTNGADGLNAATVYLFQRTATSTAPALPSATVTYTFATGVASGVNNGWYQTLPTIGGGYRWVTTATALGTGTTDTIGSTEWAAASLLAQDGASGTPGSNGANGAPGTQTAYPTVYQWNAAAPAAPTGTPTYTWATASFGAAPSGWSITPGTSPTPGYTLWAATVTVIDVATNTTTGFNWTGATVAARGVAGANGSNGARGSQTFYTALTGSTNTWSDALATSVASVGGGPILNDLDIQYNNSVGFSQTKQWNGTGWITITTVLDGNLLVTGTVGTAALAANSVTAAKILANTITATQLAANTITAAQISASAGITASQINSNGLSIKDTSGNIILSAGAPLAAQIVPGSGNLYKNGDFTVQSSPGSGLPNYFNNYNNSAITFTQSVNSGGAVGVSNYWRLTATATATANFGFFIGSSGANAGWSGYQANTDYVLSFYARTTSGSSILGGFMQSAWNNWPPTITWLACPALTTSWQRYILTLNFGTSQIDPNGYIWVSPYPKSGDIIDFSCFQLETGKSASGWAALPYTDANGVLQSSGTASGMAVANSLLTPSIASAATTANWGGVASRPSNLTALSGSEAINNASISVDGSGTIQGIGGGAGTQVANYLLVPLISDKLSASTNSVLSSTISINAVTGAGFVAGNLTWDSAGNRTGGYGTAMTPTGLLGVNSSGTTTFSVNSSTGSAYFGGTLKSGIASQGSFNLLIAGNVVGSGNSISSGVVYLFTGLYPLVSHGGDVLISVNLSVAVGSNAPASYTPWARFIVTLMVDGNSILTYTPETQFAFMGVTPALITSLGGTTRTNGAAAYFGISHIINSAFIPAGNHSVSIRIDTTKNDTLAGTLSFSGSAAFREFLA